MGWERGQRPKNLPWYWPNVPWPVVDILGGASSANSPVKGVLTLAAGGTYYHLDKEALDYLFAQLKQLGFKP